MKEVPSPKERAENVTTSPRAGKKDSDRIKGIRTYKADVEELLKKKKITRTHIAIAEEERRRALGESAVWQEHKATSVLPLLAAGAFLLIGTSILFYEVTEKNIPFFAPKIAEQDLVIAGNTTEIVGLSTYTRDELVHTIRAIARKETFAEGTHVRFAFRAKTGTSSLAFPLKNFFLTLEGSAPDALTRSLSPRYEGGLVRVGEMRGYLVFTTTYYDNAVVGLLAWEKQMMQDLYPVIDPLRAELVLTPPEGTWRAEVWNGYNLRVFTTPEGRAALLYGWVDKKTLIITGSVQAFTELARLSSQGMPAQ